MQPTIGITPEVRQSPRGAVCAAAYSDAVVKAGGVPVILPLTRDPALLRQLWQRCDGLLLTGGGDVSHKFYAPRLPARQRALIQGVDEVRDEMEIWLTRAAVRDAVPVLGICRGIQIMNVALGGTLFPDIPGHRHPQTDGLIHPLQWAAASKIRTVIGTPITSVNTTHHQALAKIAPGLRVTARAADGTIEAVEHTTARFFWGVQFHPERLVEVVPQYRRLFAAFVAAAKKTAD